MKHVKRNAWVDFRSWAEAKKQTFFRIKSCCMSNEMGNEMYGDPQANGLALHTPITPGVWSILFFESGHVAYQIKGNKVYNMQANILPLHTHSTMGWSQKVKTFFFLNVM